VQENAWVQRVAKKGLTIMKDVAATPLQPIVMRSSRVTVTLYHGDCLDLLPIDADAVVSDPPYGCNYVGSPGTTNGSSIHCKRQELRTRETVDGDDTPFEPSAFADMPCVMSGAQHYYDRLPPGGSLHAWDKRGDYKRTTFADGDIVWFSGKTNCQVYRLVWRGLCRHVEHAEEFLHPTQKPVVLMEWMLDFVPEARKVLDPFMGSGTTGIACIRRGLDFIGVERDQGHFRNAVDRIRRELSQERLF